MFFEKKIDSRSKKAMAEFLVKHYRYDTMGSWNCATSYANCVKLNRIGINGSQLVKAFDIIATDGYWDEIRYPIRDFEQETNKAYTIGSNGRSGGYLVLYSAEVYDPGYKSTCSKCGQLNFQLAHSEHDKCGVCKSPRSNLKAPLQWMRTKSSGIDQDMEMEDFMDMSLGELKNKVEIVRLFDKTCDDVREVFLEIINDFMIVEETVMVPKKVRRLERLFE